MKLKSLPPLITVISVWKPQVAVHATIRIASTSTKWCSLPIHREQWFGVCSSKCSGRNTVDRKPPKYEYANRQKSTQITKERYVNTPKVADHDRVSPKVYRWLKAFAESPITRGTSPEARKSPERKSPECGYVDRQRHVNHQSRSTQHASPEYRHVSPECRFVDHQGT